MASPRNLLIFEDNFMLKLVLKGVSNLQEQIDVRLLISLDILQNMIVALGMVAANPYDVALYTAVLLAGFLDSCALVKWCALSMHY